MKKMKKMKPKGQAMFESQSHHLKLSQRGTGKLSQEEDNESSSEAETAMGRAMTVAREDSEASQSSGSELSESESSESESELQSDEEESEGEPKEEEVKSAEKRHKSGEEAEEDDEEEEEGGAEDSVAKGLPGPSEPSASTEENCSSFPRWGNSWREQSVEELAGYFQQKYGRASCGRAKHRVAEEIPEHISQQRLLPEIKDPKLWLVRCKPGEEKATALTLLRKFVAYQKTDSPLLIKSVVAPEYLKGYIYVEAYKASHVLQAIEGVASLRQGCLHPQQVPIQEMTDVLKVLSKEVPSLQPKSWVRVRTGLYRHDLAQVTRVESDQSSVSLKLIPRIDYGLLAGGQQPPEGLAKRQRLQRRPPRQLLDAHKIRSLGGKLTVDGDFLVFRGNRYSHRGFLFKTMGVSCVLREGVKPTLAELQQFEERPEALQALKLATEDSSAEHSFRPGDKVQVSSGELLHLQGWVVSVQGPRILMMPQHELLREALEFSAWELRKDFGVGDRVQVISGRYRGTSGFVLRVEATFILLFSDLSQQELQVLPRDLQLIGDSASALDLRSQQQRWGQLVQLQPHTVGIVVGLEDEADTCRVLDMGGKLLAVRSRAVTDRRYDPRAVALDSGQNELRPRAVVKVLEGPHSGLEASILHLFRGVAFLHSRKVLDHGGLFVCKSRHLLLSEASQAPRAKDLPARDLAPGARNPPPVTLRSPGALTGPRDQALGRAAGAGQGQGIKDLVGQSVRICQGPYKGYIGMVKEATESLARVELHTTCQTISVQPQRLARLGTPSSRSQISTSHTTPSSGSQTPIYSLGSFTPLYGCGTPMAQGDQTPGSSPFPSPRKGHPYFRW
ncbi:transcription elongation factor SPT5-like [Gracilinanus agilis]|uniref:transcription elongation factor SPT5-like n=1 Tax=Gracilinanus agilis TaxID=191870 RepID=UPI001CFED96E|nr:transcription elongation factor SPT5-like [Gracilinanus agilis]